jgi:hypothetical protein
MPLRVGFDLDGVLADLNGALVRQAQRTFPDVDLKPAPPVVDASPPSEPDDADDREPGQVSPSSLRLTSRQERQLWAEVKRTPNFWESLDETEPGIVKRLADTAQAERWEVIFLTSRPKSDGDIVQLQSQRWLRAKGFEMPSVFVVSTSRGKIAASLELDVVVDDRPENCLDIAIDSKARAILIWRGDQNAVPDSARRLGIGGVPSVAACLDLLVEAGNPGAGQTSIVDRLKRLLGLKPGEPQRARA